MVFKEWKALYTVVDSMLMLESGLSLTAMLDFTKCVAISTLLVLLQLHRVHV